MTARTIRQVTVLAALAVAFGVPADAEDIALTDPSLEVAFGGSNGNTVSGWFTFGSTGAAIDVSGGFWGDMANRNGTNAAYGTQVDENDGGSIYQTV